MADRRRDVAHLIVPHGELSHGANGHTLITATVGSSVSPINAAAQRLVPIDTYRAQYTQPWQDEAWEFYASLGELNQGVEWFGEAVSRVRLLAAEVTPGGDEPRVLDTGPAVDLVQRLCGGTDGQSQLLRSLGVQLSIPGECYFVGRDVGQLSSLDTTSLDAEPDEDGRVWTVQPTNTVRQSQRGVWRTLGRRNRTDTRRGWDLQVDEAVWVPLPAETLITRVWDRDERSPWLAASPARAALPIMREIDMYNRYVIATLISRVASNGILLIPDEVTLPVNPNYETAADPFMAELIDVMRAAIKNPGSPASAAPVPLRVRSEYIERFRHLTFATPFDDKIFQARADAIKRLATTLNLPTEVLTGLGSVNHWCGDDSTQAYVRDRGWVSQRELNVGDVILTLNHETGLSEWQPVLDIYRADVTDEQMLALTSRFHSSVSTMGHRWPVVTSTGYDWRTSQTLEASDRLVLAVPHTDLPTTMKYSDEFVELVAWMTTDGSIRRWQPKYKGSLQAAVHQSHRAHPGRVAEIRRVLTALYGPASVHPHGCERATEPRWREHRYESYGMTTWVLNRVAAESLTEVMNVPEKIVTRDFIYSLTRAQLDLFINSYAAGDGRQGPTGSVISSQRDARRLDALELAATLAGYVTSRGVGTDGGFKTGPITTQRVVHPDNQNVRGGRCSVGVGSVTSYTGVVWCPTTKNGTWFAQHNGKTFFTGNSAWALNEDGIKIHISPKVEIMTRCLTVGYLHPMLRALGEPTTTAAGNRIIMWYDTSELTQRPDRSPLAVQLREMLVINDTAARRESGFDEADAPTDDELEKMILEKLAVNPQTATAALKELTGLNIAEPPPTVPVVGTPSQPSGPAGDAGDGTSVESAPPVSTTGPPKTRDAPPPAPDEGANAVTTGSRGN